MRLAGTVLALEKFSTIPVWLAFLGPSQKAARHPSIRAKSQNGFLVPFRLPADCLDVGDLANHFSTWESPIGTTYRGVRIWECPPNSQGLAALLALNILEGFDMSRMGPLSAERLHLEIEALRLAFADAHHYVSDPLFSPAPLETLLDKNSAALRRALIDPQHANLGFKPSGPGISSDTVYLCTVDDQGNACSFINSIYDEFGAGIVPLGCGFALQNRGAGFSLDPEHPNCLAPGKRPYHTIIPGLATLPAHEVGGPLPAEALYAAFGVMGGFHAAPGSPAGAFRYVG